MQSSTHRAHRRDFLQMMALGTAGSAFTTITSVAEVSEAGVHKPIVSDSADQMPVLFTPGEERILYAKETGQRVLHRQKCVGDLVVVGGGLAGVCCAVTAARSGVKVILVQDRPVLGGNASSEVRLWVLGATSHMGNNNRWAREGGFIDELLVENMWRNKEGNAVLFDTIILEKVIAEPNIQLLLNTAVFDVTMKSPDRIGAVHAFNSQNSTLYEIQAPLFCDASGDGIVGYLSGAPFRMGAEDASEFDERFAPDAAYGYLLGHTIMLHVKDTGEPVTFVPPDYALKDITVIPHYRRISPARLGCYVWWFEYGGRLDTVHDTEKIKWELWRVVYGAWNHIKNSGDFPEAETMTLEWVGLIPGKRESRRFEGDYMLTQKDIVEQRLHKDAVSFGGWSIDLHPADGVYSDRPSCDQWHAKGMYQIPYRCMYSRSVKNLLLAGRISSISHVAFGSTRVMATCAHAGQAVGAASALCHAHHLEPAAISKAPYIQMLQRNLLRSGQWIPHVQLEDVDDLTQHAHIEASSCYELHELPPSEDMFVLKEPVALLMPAPQGVAPRVSFFVKANKDSYLRAELRKCSRLGHYTPDATLSVSDVHVTAGESRWILVDFNTHIDTPQYVFLCLMHNEHITVATSDHRITGVLTVVQSTNPAHARQEERPDIGFEGFEMWRPIRRPWGRNLAVRVEPALNVFTECNVINGYSRPFIGSNAWVADLKDTSPEIRFFWERPKHIRRIELAFDTDFDHPMESVQYGHPERVMPFCIRQYRILDDTGRIIHEVSDNHQTRNSIDFVEPITTKNLVVQVSHPSEHVPAALFGFRCYETI